GTVDIGVRRHRRLHVIPGCVIPPRRSAQWRKRRFRVSKVEPEARFFSEPLLDYDEMALTVRSACAQVRGRDVKSQEGEIGRQEARKDRPESLSLRPWIVFRECRIAV